MFRDFFEETGWVGFLLAGLLLMGAACIPLAIYAAIQEKKEWAEFSATHNCKIVGRMRGDVSTTVAPIIGGNGGMAVGITSTPDKTGYQCNDGVTYWR